MNTLNNEILSAIDKIETVTMESEMNVLTAMCDAYEKSAVILENYEGDDVSCFDIFQEGFKDDVKAAVKGKNGEHIVKRILMVIPRLLDAIRKAIMRFFNKKKDQQVINNLKAVEKIDPDVAPHIDDEEWEECECAISVEDEVVKTKLNIELVSGAIEQSISYVNELIEAIDHPQIGNRIDDIRMKYDTGGFNLGVPSILRFCDYKDSCQRRFTFPNAKEYTIGDFIDFIYKRAKLCEDLLDNIQQGINSVNELIKKLDNELKNYEPKRRSDGSLITEDWYESRVEHHKKLMSYLKKMSISLTNLLQISEEEIENLDGKATGILKAVYDNIKK